MSARNDRPAPVLSEDTRRLLGLSERLEQPVTCCARCRRGTRALGLFPCGDDQCRCHVNQKFLERWGAVYKEQINSKESTK